MTAWLATIAASIAIIRTGQKNGSEQQEQNTYDKLHEQRVYECITILRAEKNKPETLDLNIHKHKRLSFIHLKNCTTLRTCIGIIHKLQQFVEIARSRGMRREKEIDQMITWNGIVKACW